MAVNLVVCSVETMVETKAASWAGLKVAWKVVAMVDSKVEMTAVNLAVLSVAKKAVY
jgi:hypothetical protein